MTLRPVTQERETANSPRPIESSTGRGAISIRGVSKSFGTTVVLRDFSLEVAHGTLVSLLGPSGRGKTTLLRLIAGLDTPDAGEIALGGVAVSGPGWATSPHTRGIGFVFQSSALWPHMTLAQNILFGIQKLPKAQAAERLKTLLAQTELEGLQDRYPDQVSGGQARRAALARALAPHPTYLLLDEPLTNVEVALKDRLLGVVRAHSLATRATVVWVTHAPEEAAALGGTVLEMSPTQVLA